MCAIDLCTTLKTCQTRPTTQDLLVLLNCCTCKSGSSWLRSSSIRPYKTDFLCEVAARNASIAHLNVLSNSAGFRVQGRAELVRSALEHLM